jgi:AbrB family looped-hinge helix DNA binding protein
METVLTSKGQLVIPKSIREAENLEPGTRFVVTVDQDHSIRLRKVDANFVRSLIGSVEKGALEDLMNEKKAERIKE